MGLVVGVVVILIKSYQNSFFLHKEDGQGSGRVKMTFAEEVTFFNKGAILKELDSLPSGTFLELDISSNRYLDHDIIEILDDFSHKAKLRDITIQIISVKGAVENPASYLEYFKSSPQTA